MRKETKLQIGIAALVLVFVVCVSLFAVRTRSWDEIAGNHEASPLEAGLTVNILDSEDEILQAQIWRLTPEQTEGAAAGAILSALGGHTYRGRLRNIAAFTIFQKATSSYAVDGDNSKGEVNLILRRDSQRSIFLTIFSGGMVVLRDHSGIGTRFFDTDPQLYEELSAIVHEYSTPQEG